MSVKSGTQQLRNATVVKSQNGTRKVRCQRCGNQAVEVPDGKGGTKHQCLNCKTVYQSSKL